MNTKSSLPLPGTPSPIARVVPTSQTLHGHTLTDDYAWLRQKSSQDVTNYLEAENAYAEAVMAPYASLQKTLYDEMISHIKETDISVPYRYGNWFYYTRTVEGQQYAIHCRKPAQAGELKPSETAAEQVLLDVNELAQGEQFMALGALTLSDDESLLAYSVDTTGFRQYTLQIKDLNTGKLLPERVERTGSIVWAADNKTLFYTLENEDQKRQYQLWRHTVGQTHVQDVLVYEEEDERFNLGAGRTRDRSLLILESASHTTSEERFLKADNPAGEFTLIAPRVDDQEYYADHRNGLLYIRTNDLGRNFRVVTAPIQSPSRQNWAELIAHRDDVMIEDIDLFKSFYVRVERENGLPHLRLARFVGDGTEASTPVAITFPEPVYNAGPGTNREWETNRYRYGYQSLVSPASAYDYDLNSGQSVLLKQQEVPGGFDPALYASERVFAQAKDGAKIPVSLVYRRDTFKPGTNPLYIYAYGSYGYSLPIGFSSNRLSLLDRGLVLAYAHIRGGGDMGKPWHDAGRLMQKMNTFTDFIAVSEHLTATKYGDPNRVAIEGGSAGGLLMGAVTNMRPDLFRAVLSHVPFVDVMNTMLDASLPLTVPEYEEWGNPNEKEAFEYMLQYSPYDNLKAADYPPILIKTSLNDSQVMYWEPAKYTAKLRRLKQDKEPLLLVTNMSAGHGGASGRYDYLKEIAFDYAFLLAALGVAQ